MLYSDVIVKTNKVSVKRTDFSNKYALEVLIDSTRSSIKAVLTKEESINYDALQKLTTTYTALKALYEGFE